MANKNNKNAIINFRVTDDMKQDVLRTSYEHELTLTTSNNL